MKRIDLVKIDVKYRIGDRLDYKLPNINEDCILYEDNNPIGFYISKMPERMCKLADLANAEFRSNRVPKTELERSDILKLKIEHPNITRDQAKALGTVQMSTILGSVPPKPHFRRKYGTMSAVHTKESAQVFVKAMIMLAQESSKVIEKYMPEQYNRQKEIFSKIPDKWKISELFTSSICNYNISAPLHKDTGNIIDSVNVIICKRKNSKGGDLHVPDYDATFGQADNSMLVYPAWRNVHGVTPIIPTYEGGYRNSLVFYPLKAFLGDADNKYSL